MIAPAEPARTLGHAGRGEQRTEHGYGSPSSVAVALACSGLLTGKPVNRYNRPKKEKWLRSAWHQKRGL